MKVVTSLINSKAACVEKCNSHVSIRFCVSFLRFKADFRTNLSQIVLKFSFVLKRRKHQFLLSSSLLSVRS